jgi:cobalt-zinc-cadmium efflux system membrane fusion protein
MESVVRTNLPRVLRVTGRLELNTNSVACVSPLVDGVVREIRVEVGEDVEEHGILAYVHSRELGESKLRLVQEQLDLKFARDSCQWYKTVHDNTSELLAALESRQTTDGIETQFRNRPIGTFRQQLLSAAAQLDRTEADYQRIRSLGKSGIVPGKQVIRAEAEYKSADATFHALLEQIAFESRHQLRLAQQAQQQAEAACAISRSQLLILGYGADEIEAMDPIGEAERIAYYPVRAPFNATVIAKHAILSQHVDAHSTLFEIADLSTVWLRADVFEKDLKCVGDLRGRTIAFRATPYSEQEFSAKVFSLGDLVDDETRTVRLLATAANPNRLLKPGMFVEIELDSGDQREVLQVPASAVQRHEGTTFVFVHVGGEIFERRDVQVGRTMDEAVEVVDGLAEGDVIVVHGGFALKSEMLSELMVEE